MSRPNHNPRARLRNINWLSESKDEVEERVLHPSRKPIIPVYPSTPTRVDMNFAERVRMSMNVGGFCVYKEPYVVLHLAVEKTDTQIRSMMEGEYFRVIVVTQHQEMLLAQFQMSGRTDPLVSYVEATRANVASGSGEDLPRVVTGDAAQSGLGLTGDEAKPRVVVDDAAQSAVNTASGEVTPLVVIGEAVSLSEALGPGEHIPMIVVEDSATQMLESSGDEYFLKIRAQEALENAVTTIGLGSGIFGNPWLTQDNLPWRTQDDGIWEAN